MLAPYKIRWQNMFSLDFDLWTELAFDNDNGSVETHLSRQAVVSESYNGVLKRSHGYKWSDTFNFSVTFTKNDYSDFTQDENRAILRWLTKSQNASFLDVYKDDSNVIDFCCLGNWVNVSSYKMSNGRIVGYVAEWESLLPYALSPLRSITKDVSNPADSSVLLKVETDEPQSLIYPKISIKQKNSVVINVNRALTGQDNLIPESVYYYADNGKYYWVDSDHVFHESESNSSGITHTSVKITNTYTKDNGLMVQTTTIKNNITGETVMLDGANKVVSSSRPSGRVFGEDFSWNWVGFAEGDNTISVEGNCIITLSWREPMKIGEY